MKPSGCRPPIQRRGARLQFRARRSAFGRRPRRLSASAGHPEDRRSCPDDHDLSRESLSALEGLELRVGDRTVDAEKGSRNNLYKSHKKYFSVVTGGLAEVHRLVWYSCRRVVEAG